MNYDNHPIKYITLSQLMSSVKGDMKSFVEKDLIDENSVIKTIAYCNSHLGLPLRRIVEKCIKVENYKAEIPKNFDKVVFLAGLKRKNYKYAEVDPFDNYVNLIESPTCYISYQQGCNSKCRPIITKSLKEKTYTYYEWFDINIQNSGKICHNSSPHLGNKFKLGEICYFADDYLNFQFEEGEIYMMYYALMEDDNGDILIPFHPDVTNWYEWCVKEKILQDIMMNSEEDVVNKLRYATEQRKLYWLDAVNFDMSPEYGELRNIQKQMEIDYYNQYFKYILY